MDHYDYLLDTAYELFMDEDRSSVEGVRYDPDASRQSAPGVASNEYPFTPNNIFIHT